MPASVPLVPRRSAEATPLAARAGYLRDVERRGPVVIGRPPLRDIADDVRAAWVPATARTIEALQNNGWLAGGVEAAISMIIGTGLKLNAQPDYEVLGMTADEAAEWSRRVERRHKARARNKYAVDAYGRYTDGQMQAAALRQFFATGESISQIRSIPRPGIASRTRVRLLPSHWLTRDSDPSRRLHHGVRLDPHGAPESYLFRMKNDRGMMEDVEYRARDRYGRAIINHIFDGLPGQVRGITIFAPILSRLAAYDKLTRLTLQAAYLHAMYAATIESDYPTEQVLAALGGGDSAVSSFMGEVLGWHENVDIRLGDYGKIPHLFTGERLNFQSAKYPNANYEPQANFLLRETARCLGCLFEDLTGDYRGATYSSLQNGIAKIWPITLYRREHIAVPFAQTHYEAWLEEEIDAGRIPFPGGIRGFLENRDAACRAEWRGPPKPVADDLKAAKSAEIYYGLGVRSQGRIAADLGEDIDDVHEQLENESKSRRNHGGLPEPLSGRSSTGDDDPILTEDDQQTQRTSTEQGA